MSTSLPSILQAAGLELDQEKAVAEGKHWKLVRASADNVFERSSLNILYLQSAATLTEAQSISAEIRRRLGDARLYVLVANSSSLATNTKLLSHLFGGEANTVGGWLKKSLRRMVPFLEVYSASPSQDDEDHFVDPEVEVGPFVEPTISDTPHKTPRETATGTLCAWLNDHSPTSPALGILLADAAVGKTTLLRHIVKLYREEAQKPESTAPFPLLISPDQWRDFAFRKDVSLEDVWSAALSRHYRTPPSPNLLSTYIRFGSLLPVFDGFDELFTHFRESLAPQDTLSALRNLVESQDAHDGKILIASRVSFWRESFPQEPLPEHKCRFFRLQQFNIHQTKHYFERRFPGSKGEKSREDANRLHSRLQERSKSKASPRERLTTLPFIVRLIADLAEGDSHLETSEREDPLFSLLKAVCHREHFSRKRTSLTPDQQMSFLMRFSIMSDQGWMSKEDFDICAESYSDIPSSGSARDSELKALRTHPLLASEGVSVRFRFDFLESYLPAYRLVSLLDERTSARIQDILEILSRRRFFVGDAPFQERVAYLLAKGYGPPPDEALPFLWKAIEKRGAADEQLWRNARGALIHIILQVVGFQSPQATREERTSEFRRLLGAHGDHFILNDMNIVGPLRKLDLRKTCFKKGHFIDSGLVGCLLGEGTRFEDCNITGSFEMERAEGRLSPGAFLNCSISPEGQSDLQSAFDGFGPTKEMCITALRLALEKFQSGAGFKSILDEHRVRGKIGKISFCKEVWEALESSNTIFNHRISGIGQKAGWSISKDAIPAVRTFFESGLLAGPVGRAAEMLTKRVLR